jgi:hypothetical protein
MRRVFWLGLGAIALAATSSCSLMADLPAGTDSGGGLSAPSVTFLGANMVQAPSQHQLAAYYCPELVSAPLGGAGLLCQGFFGPRPGLAEMSVAFDLRFRVSNPNRVPVPLASVLAAVTLFPSASNQKLGASCVQLCPPGQGGCTGAAAPDACQASSHDVRSLNDFAGAALNLLLAGGLTAATGQPLAFQAPPMSAASQTDFAVRYSLGPEPLLAAMKQLAAQATDELRQGHAISFTIPFRVEGTVWFDAGSLGRVALGYGPIDQTWVLPVEGMLSH